MSEARECEACVGDQAAGNVKEAVECPASSRMPGKQ